MSTWAIGDVQGCLTELKLLLQALAFDPDHDHLWFTGDLVSRGPASLETLRFIRDLGTSAATVLGNHDLHLIAGFLGYTRTKPRENLEQVLQAPDAAELIDWLRQQPLLLIDAPHRVVMTHAGIAPCWTLPQAQQLAQEVETALRSEAIHSFLAHMYGNEPAGWSDALAGEARLRTITNYFTRMRLCTTEGELEFHHKEELVDLPAGYFPWFDLANTSRAGWRVIFGHWAALMGHTGKPDIIAVDTGCVWGGALTAYCIEDGRRVSVPAQASPHPT